MREEGDEADRAVVMIRRRATNTKGEPYRDGRPRYEARVRGPDGRMATRTFATFKAAQAWERDKFVEKDHGGWIALSGGRMTLQQFATEWLEGNVDLAPSSRRIYDSNFRLHIFPVLGGYKLGAITPEACDRWLVTMRRKRGRRGLMAPNSVHQAYRALHRVLGVATRTRRIARNPLDAVEPPKVSDTEMRFIDHGEVARLADAGPCGSLISAGSSVTDDASSTRRWLRLLLIGVALAVVSAVPFDGVMLRTTFNVQSGLELLGPLLHRLHDPCGRDLARDASHEVP